MAEPVKRQLAMVIDLNKCIGCHTCSIACKTQWTNRSGREGMWWNNVETQPGEGFPRGYATMGGGFDENGNLRSAREPSREDYGIPWEYDQAAALEKGGDAWLRPHVKPTWGPNWDEDEGAGEYPNAYYFYLPRLCNHCTEPACLEACSRKAIYKRQEDGVVLVDQERCRGYRHCVAACPYKKVFFNEQSASSEKCIFCFPRIENGQATACAQQCVGRTRWLSFRDDREGPVYRLVEEFKVALPLHPEWGTEPNVFYVPPTSPPRFGPDGKPEDESRIPLNVLENLFGSGVKPALDTLAIERSKKGRGEESQLMDLLIGYRRSDHFKLS